MIQHGKLAGVLVSVAVLSVACGGNSRTGDQTPPPAEAGVGGGTPAAQPAAATPPPPDDAAGGSGGAPVADGETLFKTKTCFTCHGADAKTPILPEYPKLAGQNPLYALQQMKDIKSGARSNGNTLAMKGIMHLVNEEEMKVLAEYISTLDP